MNPNVTKYPSLVNPQLAFGKNWLANGGYEAVFGENVLIQINDFNIETRKRGQKV